MTNKEKALVFSTGAFDKVYDFISENAIWNVVEENIFTGKRSLLTANKLLNFLSGLLQSLKQLISSKRRIRKWYAEKQSS